MKHIFRFLLYVYVVLPILIWSLVLPSMIWRFSLFSNLREWLISFLANKPYSYFPRPWLFREEKDFPEVSLGKLYEEHPNGIDSPWASSNKNVFFGGYKLQTARGTWYEIRVTQKIKAKIQTEGALRSIGIMPAVFKGLETSGWREENEIHFFEYEGRSIGSLKMLTELLIEGQPSNSSVDPHQTEEMSSSDYSLATLDSNTSNSTLIEENPVEQQLVPFLVGRIEVLGGELQMLLVANEEIRSFNSVSRWNDLAELWSEAESSVSASWISQTYGPRLESLRKRFPNARVQLNKNNKNSSAPVQTNFSAYSEFTCVTHGEVFGDLIVHLIEGELFDESKLTITYQDLVFAPQHGIDYQSVVDTITYGGRPCIIEWTDSGQARFVTAVAADSNEEVVTLYDSRLMDSPSWEFMGLGGEISSANKAREKELFFAYIDLEDELFPFIGSTICSETAAKIIVDNAADFCESVSARVQDDAPCYLVTSDEMGGKKFLNLNPEQDNGSVGSSRRRALMAAVEKIEFSDIIVDANIGSLMLAFETDYHSLWDYAFLKVSKWHENKTLIFYGWHQGRANFGAQSYIDGDYDEGIESDDTEWYVGDAPDSALNQVGITRTDFERAKSAWVFHAS